MFSQYIQVVKTAVIALLSNKGRSFLTMLGIIIGVGAVIVIMAVGAGAQSLILNQVKSLGTNLIGIIPGYSEEDGPPASVMGIVITTLTYDDALALKEKKNVPNIEDVVAYYKGIGTLNWSSNSYDTNLNGCSSGYIAVEGGELESEAVGQRIKVKTHMFEVIGVMAGRGTVAMQDYDDQVFIPLKTMQKVMAGVNHVSMIRAKIDHEDNTARALEDIKITLRERHEINDQSGKSDDFTVRSAAQALDMITTVTNALKYFLAAMGALSLLVGGIGIMNIMLVAVTERTREIGLRKAVGAKTADILSQFLFEAVTVTSIGGLFGIVGGTLLSYLIALVAKFLGYDWAFAVSLSSVVLAVGVSMLVGLIFGLYPARKASRLEPVEALRYE